MLPFGAATPLGGLFFNFAARYPKTIVPETDFGPSIDKSVYPKEFRSVPDSSLSIRWNVCDGNEKTVRGHRRARQPDMESPEQRDKARQMPQTCQRH